ncbi:hypothetical protein ACFPOU_08175 [Massilia jejuensis]|uniref:Uncharacterized protein n=1 Tax=Massilia jejuensis TaxID=648894 RepID=A0ABW0PHL8_9BURK
MRATPKFIAVVLLVALVGPAVPVERGGSRPAAQPKPVRPKPAAAPASKYQVDCSISPDLCMTDPVARGCGEGRHWSSAGSGFAHCVEDDRNCADGKPAQRDEYDNLVCADEKAAGEGVIREEGGSTARLQDQQEKEKTQ